MDRNEIKEILKKSIEEHIQNTGIDNELGKIEISENTFNQLYESLRFLQVERNEQNIIKVLSGAYRLGMITTMEYYKKAEDDIYGCNGGPDEVPDIYQPTPGSD